MTPVIIAKLVTLVGRDGVSSLIDAANPLAPDPGQGPGREPGEPSVANAIGQHKPNRKMLDHALAYGRYGWPVLTVHSIRDGQCSCGRGQNCVSPGKHPRTVNGVKDATTDAATITRWWTQFPDANVALATGELVVIDVDPRHGGDVALAAYESEHGPLHATLESSTGGKGRHLFYRQPTGAQVRGRNPWMRGVEVKSHGGYVLLPGSNHISGGTYTWVNLGSVSPVSMPADLAASINGGSSSGDAAAGLDVSDPAAILRGVPEGERNTVLFRWACRLRRQHSTDTDGGRTVVTMLILAAARNALPPFPDSEAMVVVESAFQQQHDELDPRLVEWARTVERPSVELGNRVQSGGAFILDEPDKIPAVWGEGDRVLWAEGEGVMLTGHQGVGKTTIGQQFVLHRIGVRDGPFLGLPVQVSDRPVLYLAMDRPRQAARSFRRMVNERDRPMLDQKLIVWRGPLPGDVLASLTFLADFAQRACPGVGTIVVDSVKDLAPGLSKDEIGAGLQRAFQEVIARDVELLLLHHERKAGSDSKRTHKLDDVYGSTWLTSGLGSVIALNGDPGDPTIELFHLKQPAEPVGPLTIRHEHAQGLSLVLDTFQTVAEYVVAMGPDGVTAEQVARTVYGRSSDADQKRARRELAKLVSDGLVEKVPGLRAGAGARPDAWRASATTAWAVQQT